MREFQATLHACGEDFPPNLGDADTALAQAVLLDEQSLGRIARRRDGWEFRGWHVEDHGGGPFMVALWERRQ